MPTRSQVVNVSDNSHVRPYEKLRDDLQRIAQLDEAQGAGFEIASQVIDKIASATSLDDIYDANEQGPADIEDFAGQNLTVVDMAFLTSSEEYKGSGLGVYVVLTLDKKDATGNPVRVSTGAPNIVSSCRSAQLHGYGTEDKPLRFRLHTKSTKNGTLYLFRRPTD